MLIFEKYITNYNVTDFVRLIKFFDNSLFKMIEDFTPARTSLSSGVVVKQHLLERNRQRPAQVTSSFEQYSGSVRNLPKNYSLGSTDYPQYSRFRVCQFINLVVVQVVVLSHLMV